MYSGELPGEWHVAPEAATLLDWARALGIPITAAREEVVTTAPTSPDQVPSGVDADDVLCALSIKGATAAGALGDCLMATAEALGLTITDLSERGLVEAVAGQVRLTASGKAAAAELHARDRERLGPAVAVAVLDEFHDLDGRMKTDRHCVADPRRQW